MLRIVALCLIGACISATAVARTWTDCTGLETFDAEITSVANGVVTFTKSDGTRLKMPIEKLSNGDITFVKQYIKTAQSEHRSPPDPAGSNIDRQAAIVNDFIKKLKLQADAAASQDTSVRETAAGERVAASLDAELRRTHLVFRFPITNVEEKGHGMYMLSLAAPEKIEGISGYPMTFNVKISKAEAVRITTNHVLVVHGTGKLVFGSEPNELYSSAAGVADIYVPSCKQFFAICLEDYHWKTEREVLVKVAPLADPQAPVARAAGWPQVQAQPLPTMQPPAATNQPTQVAPPVAGTTHTPTVGDLLSKLLPGASQPPSTGEKQPQVLQQPPQTKISPRVAERPAERRHPMDLRLPSARYLHGKLTPEMMDQRKARLAQMYGPFYDVWSRRPNIWVGGFISPVFWYSMEQWPCDRQAVWLYNYQNVIEPELLADRLQNSAVNDAYHKLRVANTVINPYFVDPQFTDDPDLMYRDEFVDAVYRDPDFEDNWSMPYSWLIAAIIAGVVCIIAWSRHEG